MLFTYTFIEDNIMEIPTVDDIYEWLQEFSYNYSYEPLIINYWPKLYMYIQWKINDHIASNKPYISKKKLLFGTENVSLKNVYSMLYAIEYYFSNVNKISKLLPNSIAKLNNHKFPVDYIENIKVYYSGIPNLFINIYHNYILHLARQNLIYYTFENRTALLAFLIICVRKHIPNEIIHLIFIYLGVNTYRSTMDNTIILNNGIDFSNSIKKINAIANAYSLNYIVKSLIERYRSH